MSLLQMPLNPLNPVGQGSSVGYSDTLPLLVLPDGNPGEEKYEREVDELFVKLHRALWNRRSAHRTLARNPIDNYKVYYGELTPDNHRDVLAPWRRSGLQILQDYSFFTANGNILFGMVEEAGLKFSTVAKGPEWQDKKKQKNAEAAAEETLRMASQLAQQQAGEDVSGVMTDESIYVPQSEDEWHSPLPEQQRLEMEVYERLDEDITKNNVHKELIDTLEDQFIIEIKIAEIVADNAHTKLERLGVEQVSWWGPEDAETEDDMDAWAIRRNLTPSQIVAKYGSLLNEASNKEALLKELTGVSGGPADTFMQRYTDGTLNQVLSDFDRTGFSPILPGYDSKVQAGPGVQSQEQKIYVKLIKPLWFRLRVDVDMNGDPTALRDMTEEEYKSYKEGRYPFIERVIYDRLTSKEAEQLKKAGYKNIRALPIAELWESVRLGEAVLYRRPCPWQEREPGRLSTPSFPIIASFGKDTSLVTKGLPLHELYTNVMIVLRKKVALAGVKSIGVDVSQLPKGYSMERFMYEAKESGFLFFNGKSLVANGSKDSYRHLQPVDMSMDDDIIKLLGLATMLHETYDRLCGITPALKGIYQNREALGQTQLGKASGSLATQRFFAGHGRFVQRALSRMVSLGKYIWPRQQSPRAQAATLETVRSLPLHYYGVYLENTLKAQEDKQFLMSAAREAVSAGGVSFAEIIRMYYSDSPQEALSIFQDGLSAYERQQAELQQQGQQTQQAMAEAAGVKAQMPLQVEEMRGQWHMELEKMKAEMQSMMQDKSLTHEEDKVDIQNSMAQQQQVAQ